MSEDFKAGDTVALKKEFLKASEEDVSCTRLLQAGFPNEFLVAKVQTRGDVPALVLSPCCGRLVGKSGEKLCDAHPAALFEIVRRASPEGKAIEDSIEALWKTDPKRFLAIDLPLLGPVVRMGHYEEGDKEGLAIQIGGTKPLVVVGKDLETLAGLLSRFLPGRKKG